MQYALSIPVLLLALLAALTRGDESQPLTSSQSVSDQHVQGSWGKRDVSLDYLEDDDFSGEDKRAWGSLRGTWGKRASDLESLVSRGKRNPNWQSLKGLWGKRSFDSLSDESRTEDARYRRSDQEETFSKDNYLDENEDQEETFSKDNYVDENDDQDPFSKNNYQDEDEDQDESFSKNNYQDEIEDQDESFSKNNYQDEIEDQDPFSKNNYQDEFEDQDPFSKNNYQDEDEDEEGTFSKDSGEDEPNEDKEQPSSKTSEKAKENKVDGKEEKYKMKFKADWSKYDCFPFGCKYGKSKRRKRYIQIVKRMTPTEDFEERLGLPEEDKKQGSNGVGIKFMKRSVYLNGEHLKSGENNDAVMGPEWE